MVDKSGESGESRMSLSAIFEFLGRAMFIDSTNNLGPSYLSFGTFPSG